MRTACCCILIAFPLIACGNPAASTTGGAGGQGGSVPSTCPTPTHGPTKHNSVNSDQTWTADESPHVLPYDSEITATLTLEPCAEVRLAAGRTITISDKGSIVGIGAASKRILITADDDAAPWGSIRALGGSMTLSYATVQNGGEPGNTAAVNAGMLYAQYGSDYTKVTDAAFALQHVVLKGSKSNGALLTGDSHFSDDSTDLTVSDSTAYPLAISPRAASSVPDGDYTANPQPEILFPGSGATDTVVRDQTVHARGVPYHVGTDVAAGELRVGASSSQIPLATLTIEAGVTIRFKKGGYFEVEEFAGKDPASGALIAKGTSDQHIIFTSAEASPAPGDWIGIIFGGLTDPTTALDNVEVQYAGMARTGGSLSCAPGPAQAAINIFGQPPAEFVTNSTISHSTAGFNSGWSGSQIDFTALNLFDDVPGCKLTNPPDGNNNCAGRPPCAVP
jgi:hypothetical protein